MTMGDLRLASAGDEVKLWDCGSYSLITAFNPHHQPVSALCWSPDGSLLASSSCSDDNIILSCAESTVTPAVRLECQGGAQCLDYSSSGGMVLSGSQDGVVAIWDIKSRKQRRVFKEHKRAVTCVAFNWNHSHVASGSESGDVLLHNTVSGMGNSPLVLPRSPAIKALSYSHFKKSLLAACADDGQVGLWDVDARRLLHAFAEHTAPATALAFSPVNELLMLSTGLDKRLIYYDVQRKVALRTTVAETPLTVLDIFHDGATVAAGTTRGMIYVYDLRQSSNPVRQMHAHKSSVQRLQFQPAGRQTEGGSAKTGSAVTMATSRRQLPHVPAAQPGLELSNGDVTVHSSLEHPGEEEVFSPLRDGEFQNASAGNTSGAQHSALSSHSSLRNSSSSYSGVFSPLRDTSGLAAHAGGLSLSTSLSPHTSWQMSTNNGHLDTFGSDFLPSHLSTSINSTAAVQDSSLQVERQPGHGVSASPSLTEEQVSRVNFSRGSSAAAGREHSPLGSPPSPQARPLPTKDSPSASSGPGLDSLSWVPHGGEGSGVPSDTAWSWEQSSRMSREQSGALQAGRDRDGGSPRQTAPISPGKQGEQLQQLVTAAMRDVRREMREEVRAMREEMQASLQRAGGRGDMGDGASAFQSQFLQNLVRDAVSEVSDRLHRDIVTLQVEMLHQFHLQEAAVREMLRQHSINEDLVAEIERLKEENRLLRKTRPQQT